MQPPEPSPQEFQAVRRTAPPDQGQRILSAALALLLVVQVLLAGLAPHAAAAAGPHDAPLQLQAVCHGAGPAVQQPTPDAPRCPLPCCMLCCGSVHGGTWAPPGALGLAPGAQPAVQRTLDAPTAIPFTPQRQTLRPPLRGPPLVS